MLLRRRKYQYLKSRQLCEEDMLVIIGHLFCSEDMCGLCGNLKVTYYGHWIILSLCFEHIQRPMNTCEDRGRLSQLLAQLEPEFLVTPWEPSGRQVTGGLPQGAKSWSRKYGGQINLICQIYPNMSLPCWIISSFMGECSSLMLKIMETQTANSSHCLRMLNLKPGKAVELQAISRFVAMQYKHQIRGNVSISLWYHWYRCMFIQISHLPVHTFMEAYNIYTYYIYIYIYISG